MTFIGKGSVIPRPHPFPSDRIPKISRVLLVEEKVKRITNTLLCAWFILVVGCALARGQGATAQISGTVTDQSGAVLPGVEITATHTETGVSRNTVSNETGVYVLPNRH